jgi:predicted alpha/beta hydrolase family esterase
MKTVFIIHGTWGSPEWNWFSWMKKKLEQEWFQVFIPVFPTPDNQSLNSWLEIFQDYKRYVDSDTIFIAHSVWPSFVCAILEKLNMSVKSCYFASWFLWNIDITSFDLLNDSFVNKDFAWGKITNNSQSFYMCHGNNDPYVPLKNAQNMADNLWVEIDMIEGGWHLNEESWYREFEYLLEKIK